MLNFSKTILEKVSFDYKLLNKEYRKCLSYLNKNDRTSLKSWIKNQDFSDKILNKINTDINQTDSEGLFAG